MNNKGLLGINVVLIIAVIVLFILQFSGPKAATEEVVETTPEQTDTLSQEVTPTFDESDMSELPTFGSGLKIAYVNMDSLALNYQYMTDANAELIKDQADAERKMIRKRDRFQEKAQREMADLEARYQRGELFQDEVQREMAKLQEEGYKIDQELQSVSQMLATKQYDLNIKMIDDTERFLKVIGDELGYDYVLPYSKTQSILYAKDAYDITEYVLRKLNEAYAANKDVTEVEPDLPTNK